MIVLKYYKYSPLEDSGLFLYNENRIVAGFD